MKTLVFDPNDVSRDTLRRTLASLGCPVRGFADASEAWRALREFGPDLVISDVEAEGGETLLREARNGSGRTTLALVGQAALERGVAAVSAGAHDFLWRPVSPARVAQLVAAAAARRERESRTEEMRLRLAQAEIGDRLPGRSEPWTAALAALERAARSEGHVLVTGEAGTEKDAAALAVHRLSSRGAERFAFISEGESLDLAVRQAGSGSLFVPAVEATSPGFQEMIVARLHGQAGTRFVVSTDEDPAHAVAEGRFSRSLFEATSENTVHLPPLRERKGDVALLARRFLDNLSPELTFDLEALDVLGAHAWPGNVRELDEVVRRAAQFTESPEIGPTTVRAVLGRPLPVRPSHRRKAPAVRIAVGDSLADVERRLILKTLAFARGNKKKTAELLKLSLKTIYNKIKEYGLEH